MRYNLQIKTGSYVGDGADNHAITDVGFSPDLVIVKGGVNIACFKTKHMPFDLTAFLAGNIAHFSGGVKGLLPNGFQVGTDAKVNANGTTYYYIAIKGYDAQNFFRVFTYVGKVGDNRQLNDANIFFTPDIAWAKGNNAQNPSVRTKEVVGDNSWHFSGSIDAVNEIQAFISNGLELGNSSRINQAGIDFYGIALKHYPGIISSGIYIGDGADNRAITGIGFKPDIVLVKNGAVTNTAALRTADIVGDGAFPVGASDLTANFIQSLDTDGFTLGSNASINGNGNLHYWIALKAGTFLLPITRTAI